MGWLSWLSVIIIECSNENGKILGDIPFKRLSPRQTPYVLVGDGILSRRLLPFSPYPSTCLTSPSAATTAA
jgi:hypothetical protein